mmetsp:Transcript_6000/g.12021  ORF Transcript_6000/g.12021 Transcript_6000/m.12021 type:complete len:224 (-) Transcript_6000:314-985(-)
MSAEKTYPTLDGRTFAPAEAHGGEAIEASSTALVMIEFQNEFVTEGGKLHDGVKEVMASNGMLEKSAEACAKAREKGAKVFLVPITFKEDKSDNPNKGQGILKGCADGALFTEGSWNAEICKEMTPQEGDVLIEGKRGLDAFPGSNLEAKLLEHGIKTVALGGFLTNCCVESTMRTAFEKGFNVVTLTDCTATTSMEGQKAACEGTFGMFSTPMTKDEFLGKI